MPCSGLLRCLRPKTEERIVRNVKKLALPGFVEEN